MTKMHKNEFAIDQALVGALLQEQCPQWADLPLQALASSGTDHALFRLGEQYVVRLPRIEWKPGSIQKSIDKEYQWIPQIARFLQTPISEPVFKGKPHSSYPWPWLVVKWNKGDNPTFESKDEYVALAADLAGFLNELHAIKLAQGPFSRRGVPLQALDIETSKAICALESEIDIQAVTALWQKLSALPAWHHPPVWVHGDFLPGNILMQNNRLRAVIDFSDVGIGDPACDLVIAWGLLNAPSRKIFKNHLRNIDENTWKRGQGWALSIALIMLPYYKHSNPALAALAKRMLRNILEEQHKKCLN